MKTTHIKGLSVVSIGTGEKLGSVSEVLLDAKAEQVAAFAVETGGGGGMLSSQPSSTNWIAAANVHAIGPDALTVQDASALAETGGDDSETIALALLMGEKVVTEGGTYLGQVASVEIDEATMAVSALEVSPGFFKSNRMVAKADFITVGEELVIVSDSVVAAPPPAETDSADEMDTTPTEVTETYGARRSDEQ